MQRKKGNWTILLELSVMKNVKCSLWFSEFPRNSPDTFLLEVFMKSFRSVVILFLIQHNCVSPNQTFFLLFKIRIGRSGEEILFSMAYTLFYFSGTINIQKQTNPTKHCMTQLGGRFFFVLQTERKLNFFFGFQTKKSFL